jgi:hypothetical protein
MMAVVFYPSLSVFPQDASIWTSSQEAAKRDIKRKKKKRTRVVEEIEIGTLSLLISRNKQENGGVWMGQKVWSQERPQECR